MLRSKKYGSYLLVLVFVVLLNFWLPRLLPGGPVEYITGGGEEGAVFLTEAQKAAMLEYYHLNDSLGSQFVQYLKGIVTFEFGLSISHKAPVSEVIMDRVPWTLLIVGTASVLSILIGLLAGLYSAWRHPGRTDRSLFITMLGISAIPEFLIGMTLLIFFAVKLHWLPLSGAKTAFLRSDDWLDHLIDIVRHAVLPALTLTIESVASMYLLMRNEAVRVRNEPYVEFAAAKGIGSFRIVSEHITRNAALPLVTLIILRIGFLMAGSVLVETVFAYPGIGKLLQEAILGRDYPLLHGLFLIMTLFVLLLNLIADLIYPYLDPRIRTAGRGDRA
ncbi:peptide/nickel transport system permease protein [Paenibacillus cellulosilyticus]|uniref:Peptide/nickel transport system permease protein n=1 Tax=Paenibacillus cellulosilyticus TaxID=375489 RepID=A0A2V2YVM4_9BACL|nr:ABC transporter permease [Paenibacillus cellulosilyticus]PWW05149.1 peptide/nickel transport system permease protein [Paenibacillus cellulosilyticus]QKS48691.1 ABC transporter permease [Paenibacillus cellulosilyticus]